MDKRASVERTQSGRRLGKTSCYAVFVSRRRESLRSLAHMLTGNVDRNGRTDGGFPYRAMHTIRPRCPLSGHRGIV